MTLTQRTVLLNLLFLSLLGNEAGAQTLHVYPASSRKENTIDCIGNELNAVRFGLFADKWGETGTPGKYPISGITQGKAEDPIVLRVDVPSGIEWVGAVGAWPSKAEFMPNVGGEKVAREGAGYVRHLITLDKAMITERIIKNKYSCGVAVWLRLPAVVKARLYWKLTEGERVLVEGDTGIRTVGLMESAPLLPKRFLHYQWYPESVPVEIMKERASFYRRMGITHVGFGYPGWDDRAQKYARELRESGVKVIAERGASFTEIITPLYSPASFQQRGVGAALDELCRQISGESYKKAFGQVSEWVDGSIWDYEPGGGAGRYPGYDEPKSIKAFCEEHGLGELTTEQVKNQHAKEYREYRMKWMGRPAIAFGDLIRSVKPGAQVWLCQGSSQSESEIDFHTYEEAVDYLLPMFYTPAKEFHRCTQEAAKSVGPGKLVPVTMVCGEYIMSCDKPCRSMLDYIGTASLGAAGIAFWPGTQSYDGQQFYEFYRAARMLALVESFYTEGKETKEVEIKGLPYLEKKVEVGTQVLDLIQPNWKADLIAKAHSLDGRILVTLLNYHASEDAYVELRLPGAKGKVSIVNQAEGVYLTIKGKSVASSEDLSEGVLVHVPAYSPALWLMTGNKKDLKGLKPLAMERVREEFERKQAAAKGLLQSGEVPMGKEGDLSVGYAEVVDPKEGSQVCLEVISPSQKVLFTSSGGRIWKWEVGGKDVVARSMSEGGVGMDLIWLPIPGRWTGEQKAEMTLKKATNTGHEVEVTYEGTLKSVGVRLEKTYRILSDGSKVGIHVKLTNVDLVNPNPSTVSYWSHNVFDAGATGSETGVFMVAGEKEVMTFPDTGDLIFSNLSHGKRFEEHLLKPVKRSVRNFFGEYFPSHRLGVVVRVPGDFMQIYHWKGESKGSLEWMHLPTLLHAGKSAEFDYEMEICPSSNAEAFMEKIATSAK